MNGFAGELTVRNWFDMPVEPWTVRGLPCGMAFYLYMLRCADGSYYTGHSDDLDRRVHEHHTGLIPGCYTHDRRPLALVYVQEFGSREEGLAAEVQVKRWNRAKKEALIAQDWDALQLLARPKGAGESVHGSTGSPRTELAGGSTSSPRMGGSTGSPRTELFGGSVGSPQTGGSTGSPRTGRLKGSPRTELLGSSP